MNQDNRNSKSSETSNNSKNRPQRSNGRNRPGGQRRSRYGGGNHSNRNHGNQGRNSGNSHNGKRRQNGGRKRAGQPRRRRPLAPPKNVEPTYSSSHAPLPKLPPLGDNIRVMPLGGVEEVGRNMTAIEIGNDIIVIDMGFQFKTDDTPGIDYILPNIEYLEANKDRIRGVVITHGHLDHIGGIPYLIHRIGNPPIYTRLLPSVMIKKRQTEFPHDPELDIHEVEESSTITLGETKIRFFSVTHTIPESMGVIIETPQGWIVSTGDLKIDHVDGVPSEDEEKSYSVFKDANVLLLIADSTNVEKPGWSIPEWKVHENLERIIADINGRLVIGTFSSQIDRIIKIIHICEKLGKKVIIEGRSMKQNIEIIKHLGLLEPKPGTFINSDEMKNYPPDRIVCLATGAQGDEFAALMRMSTRSHRQFVLTPRDTILLSSSVIPGNENAVQKLKDNLARQGVKIIHYRTDEEVHASGHANQEEALWVHKQINPKFFIPVHGSHYMLRVHADMAETRLGYKRENIVIPENSSIIEIREDGKKLVKLDQKLPDTPLVVDGFSIGPLQEVVTRDRKLLADDGMFVVVASINPKTGRLRKSPDIISRGFVYLRESQGLLNEARNIIRETVESATRSGKKPVDFDDLKDSVAEKLSNFLYQKTHKQPIIIPVIIGV